MSDHQAGTGPHPSPQNLNVASGQTVRIQQVLTPAPQNVNVITTRGQQFVITSHVNVPGLTQVIPTIAGSNAGIQQGVTRILNITPSPRVNVVGVSQVPGRTGSVQLTNTTSNNASGEVSGRSAVSLVAISQPPTVNAASHPTLVSTLSSPPRQRTANSLGIMQSSPTLVLASPPTVRSPSNPHGTLSHSTVGQSSVSQVSVPRKRIRLTEMQERSPPTEEIAMARKKVLDHKTAHMSAIREQYAEHTAELFFLQLGGNMMDYFSWRKRPPSAQFLHFLRTNPLDPEDDDEDLTQVLSISMSAPSVNIEVKPNVTNTVNSAVSSSAPPPVQQVPDPPSISASAGTVATTSTNASPVKQIKSPVVVRQHPKSQSISTVYDTSLGNQEQIAEKAKQEAYVMQRIVELQKEGLWSEKRLPKVQEPPRAKAHWDYLVEEMVWLAADFAQERKWKKAAAKKCARAIQKYFQEKAIQAQKAEKTQELRLRKIANFIAKEVKTFWTNVEKLVEFKQQTRLEEKRKKVLDQHLSFIVDQTEKYSTWLAESMNKPGADTATPSVPPSVNSSVLSSPARQDGVSDDEFQPNQSSTDDEETIAKEEEEDKDTQGNSDEIEMLKRESELPLEDLLKELPEDYLENRDKIADKSKSDDDKSSANDDEFVVESDGESSDDEETIQEQETVEGTVDHKEELAVLEAEGEMSLEELLAKYGGPDYLEAETQDDQENETDDKSDSESDCDAEDVEGSDEEDDEKSNDEKDDVGLKSLLDDTKTSVSERNEKNAAADKEISDVAALAESIQPKGNTLSSTNVVTTIPFLLKHTLREYQHIGLDWLVTMFDRKLNGILADEMGLGKTIQTISLLAHLACEKGNWGPHLIIVPTSVMLNWEMEFKKWCPAFKILTYYGTQKERKQKRTGWTKPNAFHVCITSYKLVIQDHQSFRRKKWKYLILDEAQNIKNFKSQRWQLLLNFQTQRRLLLTGTPLQNNLMELWSLMHFLMPNVFQSHREFKEWFSNPVTGMIEGNSEYNESIIKRLHKVLRPFLLRRLKTEVEKQLPKKYEHIVMCRLSKRQRFLYDDFMSRAKTKETLATGNLLSVINVLMQLRKVCNHPNLFEVRPTVSPFQMERILYITASLVYSALQYDPFKHVDFSFLNFLLVDLETSLTAFVAHRIKKYCVPKPRIEEIDNALESAPRCPPGKIKMHVRYTYNQQPISSASSLFLNKGLALNLAGSRIGSSSMLKSVLPQGLGQGVTLRVTGGIQTQGYSVQLVQQQGGLKAIPVATLGPTQQVPGSTPQQAQQIQNVPKQDGMQRITLPAGFAQLVHTSTGRHILLASPQMVQAGGSQNSPQTTTVLTASGQRLTVVPKSGGTLANSSVSSGSRMMTTSPLTRPIVRVPPLNINSPSASVSATSNMVNNVFTSSSTITTSVTSSTTKTSAALTQPLLTALVQKSLNVASHPSVANVNSANVTVKTEADSENASQKTESGLESSWKKSLQDAETQSVFYLPELEELKYSKRKEKLSMIAMRNHRRCEACPIYGTDLRESLNLMDSVDALRSRWKSAGYVHCLNALKPFRSSDEFYSRTDHLLAAVHSAEEYVAELQDIFSRFVFCVPAVSAPQPQIHVSHPPPSQLWALKRTQAMLQQELSSKCALLHPIASAMVTQFPDPRLIQYDCGKLQVLDKLLRRLKTDHHRVLIFTQMTRMLDVLEAFLNFHGHIYLRLDGTTRVDQRQILMERFNADKRIFCFILSTRSGGIGVNLTGADTVIFYDSDWNPTMDAQAQDRCHRIGQTRDVHIYRLVSEMTVEENILKKANQKRLLGDLAIEGGNFTTAYFKSTTIQDLFNIDVGENDASRRMAEVLEREGERRRPSDSQLPPSPNEDKLALGALESALAAAEDETDVLAARTAKAEAAADLAEFDENIPLEDGETNSGDPEISRAEQEVNNIMQQLTPVERYAMKFVEETDSAWSAEQLAAAEAEIEQQKREWELGRLQAMKEEEERRSRLEDDEDQLLTFAREDSQNQIWISDINKEQMPMWCPPTPPQDDNDVYIDHSIGFLYEQTVMSESQLPPVYVKKEHKRLRMDSSANDKEARRLKIRHREEAMFSPRSLFDRQSTAIMKMRRDMKLQRYRGMVRNPLGASGLKPTSSTKSQPEQDNSPEWLIHEDWALLQAVQVYLELPVNLTMLSPAHTPNWDFVSEIVNNVSRTYRSPKQCRNRYESVIIPWEEGRLLYDVSPKKTKKNKTLGKPLQQAKANRPMRTSQLYMQDNNGMYTRLYNQRFETIKSLASKKQSPTKPAVTNPATRSSKLPALLSEHGINYDTPLTPVEVAMKRAERIAKENQKTMQAKLLEQRRLQQQQQQQQQQTKQQQLLQQQLQQQQQQQQQAALGGTVQVKAGISSPQQLPIGSVVTSAAATSSTPQAVVVGINPSQEIVANQVRAVTSSSGSLVTVANLNQAHVQVAAQRLTTVSLPSQTVPVSTPTKAVPGGSVTASKLNVQILRQLQRQQSQLHQQQLQQQQQQQQQQQHRLTPQQQLKVLQAAQASGQTLAPGQKVSVAMTSSAVGGVTAVQVSQAAAQRAQQLMNMKQVAVATAAASATGKQGVSRVTDSDVAAIIKQQQLVAAQRKGQQLQVSSQPGLSQAQAHLLAQAGIQMQQAGTSGQTQVATLVKAVSTPGGTAQSVTIPVTGMTLPHMKATLSPGTKGATPQQIRQLALHPQILQQRKLPVQKVAQLTQVAGKAGVPAQLIVQSPKAIPTTVTVQQIQQVMKHVPPQTVQHITHVVTAAPGGRTTVPNVTIDSSGRPTVSVASTLASALAGTIKVSPSAAQQQAILSQVSAALQGQHVQQIRQPGSSPMRIQAVAVQQQGQPLPAVITQTTNPPQAPNHQENTQ